jgi:hypothetical protein
MSAVTAPAARPARSSRSTLVLASVVVAIVAAIVALKFLRAESGGGAGAGGQPAPKPAGPHAPPTVPESARNAERAEIMQILVVYMANDGRPLHRKDGRWVTRSKGQARQIADSILERARASERFESLALKYTDDVDEKGQPFNGATVSIAKGVTLKNKDLEDAVFSTKAGEIHPNAIDTGHAYVVFRRDL